MTAEIQADIAAKLEAGQEVAYSVIASQQGLALGRLAGGEDAVEGGTLVIDDTGAFGGRFVVTEDGFAVEEMAVTGMHVRDLVQTQFRMGANRGSRWAGVPTGRVPSSSSRSSTASSMPIPTRTTSWSTCRRGRST